MNRHLRARLAAVISVVGLACFVSRTGQFKRSQLNRKCEVNVLAATNTCDDESGGYAASIAEGAGPSLAAILTRSASESAIIFCITLPRCAFTVISGALEAFSVPQVGTAQTTIEYSATRKHRRVMGLGNVQLASTVLLSTLRGWQGGYQASRAVTERRFDRLESGLSQNSPAWQIMKG
jgi:hypothetical protein